MVLESNSLAFLAAGVGAGLAVIGAGAGIGRLAASAMDGDRAPAASRRRDPDGHADRGGLIEGATLFTGNLDSTAEKEKLFR